jgi:hypothetical protein
VRHGQGVSATTEAMGGIAVSKRVQRGRAELGKVTGRIGAAVGALTLVTAVLAFGGTSAASAAAACNASDEYTPCISVQPASAAPGQSVTITGTGYAALPPDYEIPITFGFTPQGDLIADPVESSTGTFTVKVTVPADAPIGATTIETFFGEDSDAVTIPFTVTSTITVDQAVIATPTGKVATSFIPGQGIWYGVITNNPGSSSVSATFTAKVSGPQGVVIYNVTAPGTIPRGTTTGIFSTSVPKLAPFGTYTLKITLVVGGVTYVRQSTFTVGDPRLAKALAWMSARNGDKTVTHGSTTIPVNEYCEEVNEWAYGWFSGTANGTGYLSAHLDYQAQLAAGRIHQETNPNKSTAPAGALVFFTGADPSTGHVGIAVGDGKHYWTTDGTIHVAPLTEGDGYLGWSLAPLGWPG